MAPFSALQVANSGYNIAAGKIRGNYIIFLLRKYDDMKKNP